jgi:hypothetical protein
MTAFGLSAVSAAAFCAKSYIITTLLIGIQKINGSLAETLMRTLNFLAASFAIYYLYDEGENRKHRKATSTSTSKATATGSKLLINSLVNCGLRVLTQFTVVATPKTSSK